MSQTIDITHIPDGFFADLATNEPGIVPAAPTVDRWLSSMWGTRPGTSSRTASAEVAHPYPAEIAEWLHRMWGIPLADVAPPPQPT